MMKKIILTTALLFLMSNFSYASIDITNLGLIGEANTYFSNSFDSSLDFKDYYKFTIERVDLIAGAMAVNFSDYYKITNFQFKFYTDDTFLNKAILTPSEVKGKSYFFTDLAAGTYFFAVSGTTAVDGGEYFGKLNATSVPLPGAALLLGSAILGLVGIRRRQLV